MLKPHRIALKKEFIETESRRVAARAQARGGKLDGSVIAAEGDEVLVLDRPTAARTECGRCHHGRKNLQCSLLFS